MKTKTKKKSWVVKPGRSPNARLDERGREVPVGPSLVNELDLSTAETLNEKIKKAVQEISGKAQAYGLETIEEANDFDMDEDQSDPQTPYEEAYDPDLAEKLGRPVFPHDVLLAKARQNAADYQKNMVAAERAKIQAEASGAVPPVKKPVPGNLKPNKEDSAPPAKEEESSEA